MIRSGPNTLPTRTANKVSSTGSGGNADDRITNAELQQHLEKLKEELEAQHNLEMRRLEAKIGKLEIELRESWAGFNLNAQAQAENMVKSGMPQRMAAIGAGRSAQGFAARAKAFYATTADPSGFREIPVEASSNVPNSNEEYKAIMNNAFIYEKHVPTSTRLYFNSFSCETKMFPEGIHIFNDQNSMHTVVFVSDSSLPSKYVFMDTREALKKVWTVKEMRFILTNENVQNQSFNPDRVKLPALPNLRILTLNWIGQPHEFNYRPFYPYFNQLNSLDVSTCTYFLDNYQPQTQGTFPNLQHLAVWVQSSILGSLKKLNYIKGRLTELIIRTPVDPTSFPPKLYFWIAHKFRGSLRTFFLHHDDPEWINVVPEFGVCNQYLEEYPSEGKLYFPLLSVVRIQLPSVCIHDFENLYKVLQTLESMWPPPQFIDLEIRVAESFNGHLGYHELDPRKLISPGVFRDRLKLWGIWKVRGSRALQEVRLQYLDTNGIAVGVSSYTRDDYELQQQRDEEARRRQSFGNNWT